MLNYCVDAGTFLTNSRTDAATLPAGWRKVHEGFVVIAIGQPVTARPRHSLTTLSKHSLMPPKALPCDTPKDMASAPPLFTIMTLLAVCGADSAAEVGVTVMGAIS